MRSRSPRNGRVLPLAEAATVGALSPAPTVAVVVPRERPILFRPELVREILAGRKTVTRRPVKQLPDPEAAALLDLTADVATFGHSIPDDPVPLTIRCPYGAPGDRLWVREAFRRFDNGRVVFRASLPEGSLDCRFKPWKPGIHLPWQLHRVDLEVTGVRVERLHAITAEDAAREGVGNFVAFMEKWDTLYAGGPFSVKRNPWVWVVEFRRSAR